MSIPGPHSGPRKRACLEENVPQLQTASSVARFLHRKDHGIDHEVADGHFRADTEGKR